MIPEYLRKTLVQRREVIARCIITHNRDVSTFGAHGDLMRSRMSGFLDELKSIDDALNGGPIPNTPELATRAADQELYSQAFREYLVLGQSRMSQASKTALKEYRANLGAEGTPTGGAYPGSTAGYVVPLLYRDAIVAATKYAGPLMQIADVDFTDTGAIKAYPSDNDTANSATIQTENTQGSQVNIPVALVTLSSYKGSSGILPMSTELVQDIDVRSGIDSYLINRLGIRIGRLMNQMATTGTGSGQPTGFLTAVGSAVGTAVGADVNDGASGANTLGTADFETLQQALDFSYFVNAVWMTHPATLAKLTGQLNKYGQLLWPGLQNDVQTVNGKRILPNPYLPALPTSVNSPTVTYAGTLCFGDFSKVVIRSTFPTLFRFSEAAQYVDYGRYGFVMYARFDSNLIDGGGGAIKYLNTIY